MSAYHLSAYHFLILFLQTFVLAALLTPFMRRIAPGLGFLDQPGERKVHQQPKPVLGGAAIFLSQMIVVFVDWFLLQWLGANLSGEGGWFAEQISPLVKYAAGAKVVRTQMWGLVLGGLVVFLVGLYDDRFGMSPFMKLAGQILAGIILYAANIRATFLIPSEMLSFVLTIFWVVLITNSFNLLDNMDGLSGGVATISLLALALATNWLGAQDFITAYLVTLAGAIVGFLLYNFYPSTIFMGDAGSMFVGYNLAAMSILATFLSSSDEEWSQWAIIMPIVVMAVPIFDTLSVIIIRIKNHKPIFVGDKNHFSHRLVAMGMSHRGAVLTIYMVTLCTGVGALLLPHVDATGALLILVQTIAIFCIIALLEYARNHHNRTQ